MTYTPKNCVDGLVADLGVIERDFIDKEDLTGALIELQCKLLERHYLHYRNAIAIQLHSGRGFCSSLDVVLEELGKNKNPRSVLRMLRAYAAQTSLPFNPDY